MLLDTKFENLPANMLFKIQSVRALFKIISNPDEEYFSRTAIGCTSTQLFKIL